MVLKEFQISHLKRKEYDIVGKMVNYQLGKIYKIVDLDSNQCYIGSTCEPTLAKRLAKHVSDYRQHLKGKGRYITSSIILSLDDYDIVLIEAYPCNSKDELHARERHYTQLLPCVNKIKNQGLIKEIGVKEYKKLSYETSIDKIKAKYQINKEQIHKHDKQLYECKCGSNILRLSDKARHFKTIKHTTWQNIQNLPN
jgi:hypothetical protein